MILKEQLNILQEGLKSESLIKNCNFNDGKEFPALTKGLIIKNKNSIKYPKKERSLLLKSKTHKKSSTIFLKGVKHEEINSLLYFMYQGRVSIGQIQEKGFIELERTLEVEIQIPSDHESVFRTEEKI